MLLDSSIQKKIEGTDTDQILLNIYRDQAMNVNTVRQCLIHFSSGNSDANNKQCCATISVVDVGGMATVVEPFWP